jgi:hypothetical protein
MSDGASFRRQSVVTSCVGYLLYVSSLLYVALCFALFPHVASCVLSNLWKSFIFFYWPPLRILEVYALLSAAETAPVHTLALS